MGAGAAVRGLLYPPKCAFCGRMTEAEAGHLCPRCRESLPSTGRQIRRKAEFLETVLAPLYYEGAVRRSLLRYKFQGVPALSRAYAPLLAEAIRRETALSFHVVTWVPLSARRLRRRGYDQARLLAEATARELGLPSAPLLKKVRNAPPQSGAGSGEKRRANISGCFEVLPGLPSGARVLLIDDILTTGATLSECGRVLMLAGAEQITGAVLACRGD